MIVRSGRNDIIKTYLTKNDGDFLWSHLKDLKNQSCQIILSKFEKYNTENSLPLKIYIQNLNNFTSIKVKEEQTIFSVLKQNFPHAFLEESFKPKFSSKLRFIIFGVTCYLSFIF